jgi:glucose-6-phosphate-specific signal transduction histidine kinase
MLSYSSLGWVLADMQAPWFAWFTLVLTTILLIGTVTAPYSDIAIYSNVLLASSIRSFFVAVGGAFFFFLMIAWFRVFLDTLLIVCAALLTRIDFQANGFTEWQAFIATLTAAIMGVGLGTLINMLLTQRLVIAL